MSQKNQNRLFAVISLLISAVLIAYFARHFSDTENLIRRFGILAPLVTVVIYGLLSLTPISTDPLTLITGVLFGPVIGVLVSWMGNNLASMLEFFVGDTISSVTNFEQIKGKLPLGLGKLPADSPWFLIFGRFIPGYGGKIVSLIAGVYHVSLWRYIWTTFSTNLVGSLVVTLGGYSLIKNI